MVVLKRLFVDAKGNPVSAHAFWKVVGATDTYFTKQCFFVSPLGIFALNPDKQTVVCMAERCMNFRIEGSWGTIAIKALHDRR